MRDIHCPKDIGFENTFSGEDCKKEQHYNNCYHCWSTSLAKEKARWVMSAQEYCPKCGRKMYEGILEQLAEEQNTLLATIKAWSDVIEKNGYVN